MGILWLELRLMEFKPYLDIYTYILLAIINYNFTWVYYILNGFYEPSTMIMNKYLETKREQLKVN